MLEWQIPILKHLPDLRRKSSLDGDGSWLFLVSSCVRDTGIVIPNALSHTWKALNRTDPRVSIVQDKDNTVSKCTVIQWKNTEARHDVLCGSISTKEDLGHL